MTNDPREPRTFTDFSDYPQDGFGNLDAEKVLHIIPLYPDDEEIYEEDDLDLENDWEEV